MISKFFEKSQKFFIECSKNKHFRFGLPFFFFMGFGLFSLREFQTVRYEFRKSGTFNKEELEKYNVVVKKPETLEETYRKMQNMDIDNWENIRGPKYLYDNEEGKNGKAIETSFPKYFAQFELLRDVMHIYLKLKVIRVIMELICTVQKYHWGKKGNGCLVGKIASANSGVAVGDEPFAEFWMGTHPNGPSYLKATKVQLAQYLSLHSNELGAQVISQFGVQLPFLFKVLSIEQPLSIQAHPTKSHAEDLFRKFPQIYKDGNHKPELAVAVTKFEALCGFRPLSEIKHLLQNIVEFKMLIDPQKIKDFLNCDESDENSRNQLKNCFQSFMTCEGEVVANAAEKLLARAQTFTSSERDEYLIPLVEKLYSLFPKDVGVFCVYFLNYMVLSPGEALYLAPNEPHAYLYGDCLECMANSDNVVRAGLTPKFRDIKTLCEMLTYKCYQPSEIIFRPTAEDEFSQLFSPPVKDFALVKISLPKDKKYCLRKRDSASILLVLSGKGKLDSTDLELGKVFFIPCGAEYLIHSDELVLFQAFCNI